MANYLGTTYKPATQRTDENFALMVQVAQMKQSVYDTKKSQIQQTLDAFGNIDVLRDEDKEYIAAKLGSLKNDINAYGNRDLSQSGVGDEIMSKIKVAAQDPFIQAAIEDSYKMKSFQMGVAKKQEKGDGSYNETNYSFALSEAGYEDYMKGDKKRLGNLQYSDYSDYNKKINDFVIDLEGKKKDQKIEVQEIGADGQPTGRMIEQTISGLSPQQLRSVAMTMLDPKDQKQIEIDGWYNNGGYDNPNILTNVKSALDFDIQDKDGRIKSIELKLSAGSLSTSEKAAYQTELANMNSQKSSLLKNLDYLMKSPKAAATYLEQNKVIDNTVARFASLYTESRSTSKDDVYWAQKNYDLEVAKHRYTMQKDATKAQEEAGGGANIVAISQGIPETEDEIQSYEKAIDEVIAQSSQELDSSVLKYRGLLEEEVSKGNKDAKGLMDIYKIKLKSKLPNQTDADVFRAVITENVGNNSPLLLLGGENHILNIKENAEKLTLYAKGRDEAEKKARLEHVDKTLNSQEVFTAFNDNGNTMMMWNGKATPVHTVLKQVGLMDKNGTKIGDMKSKPDVMKALQASYYADDVLTSFGASQAGVIQENDESLRSLATSLGENPRAVIKKEAYDRQKKTASEGNPIRFYLSDINPNTKTGQFLLKAQQEGIYDRFAWSDQSLSSDDATIGGFINDSWRKSETYKQDLARYRDKLPNSQVLGVSPTDKAVFNQLVTTAQAVDYGFNPSKDRTIRVQKVGEFVEISQSGVEGTGDKKQTVSQPVRVTWQDFQRNVPGLAEKVEFDSKSAIYTYDKLQDTPIISEPIRYIGDKSSELFEYNSEVILRERPHLKGYLTKTDSNKKLIEDNRVLTQRLPSAASVINAAVEESGNYSVQINMTAKYGNPKLHLKLVDKATGESIHTISEVGYTDADNFKKTLDSAPQVYYSMLIDNILKMQLNDMSMGSTNESYEKLKASLKIQ